jgi:hypothetical protein
MLVLTCGVIGMTEQHEQAHKIDRIIFIVAAGAISFILAQAVNSMNNMNKEIRDLSVSVGALSAQSEVINITVNRMEHRIDEIESQQIRLREKMAKVLHEPKPVPNYPRK